MVTYRGRDKYSSKWTVSQVSEGLKEQMIGAFKDNPVVTFWPEPKFKTREIYDVAWSIEDISFPYSDLFKNAGRTIEAEMTEV